MRSDGRGRERHSAAGGPTVGRRGPGRRRRGERGWRDTGARKRAPAERVVRQAAAAAARSADSIVLISSIVMVIGPTPPGTGVM